MAAMIRAFLILASALAAARAQVALSGTVLDSHTRKGIPGASLTLLGKGMMAASDADGAFRLPGASPLHRDARPGLSGGLSRNGADFLFDHAGGPADIGFYRLSGRRVARIHTGGLEAGRWSFLAPSLPAGLYLCRVRAAQGEFVLPFAASPASGPRAGAMKRIGAVPAPEGAAVAAAAAKGAAAPADSLLIAKPGYYPSKIPLDNLTRDGLEILLTDTVKAGTAAFVPDTAWPCGQPAGLAPPAQGDLVFQATLNLSGTYDVGMTQYGRRRLRVISGGSFTGSRIQGTVLAGGLDLELILSNGVTELEQINVLRASDGTNIYVRNLGTAPAGVPGVRVALDFEAPTGGAQAWLNTGTYVGTRVLDASGNAIKLNVYDVSKAAIADPKIKIAVPPGTHQPTACLKLTGTKGTAVFTETVTLGASFSFTGKRGTRNIIPITGGSTSGRVTGRILSAGADYQLSGLDARYMLAPSDGEYVLVRNCGPMGALVPQFEARADGPYAFLNSNTYLSSDPGSANNGVSITFSERK